MRGGLDDSSARIPALRPLRNRCVAVLGLGALGAPAAIELARSGLGELRLVDHDFVDPATTVRWPFGLAAAGKPKVEVVAGFVRANYPNSTVKAWRHRIGAVRCLAPDDSTLSDLEVIDEVLEGVDLIIDFTAETGISDAIADLASEREIPFLAAWATPGAWGGVVARVRPKRAGCWYCVRCAFDDGTLPPPPADPTGIFQPAGCGDPTFTGAGFDLNVVSGIATRLVVSTLCADETEAYPDSPWDIAVIEIRNDQLVPGPKFLSVTELRLHPNCPTCTHP
jgi:molybdopterin/thiamine biosynthesis adenylyltransferase